MNTDLSNEPSPATPERKRRFRVSTPIRILVSVTLLIIVFSQADWQEFSEIFRHADVLALLIMAMLAIFDRLLSAYRWYLLLHGKDPAINLSMVFRITFISNFLGLVVPGAVGIEIVRIYGVSRATANMAMSVSSVILERFFALLALISLVLIGLALLPEQMPSAIAGIAWFGLAAMVAGFVLLMLDRGRMVTRRLLDRPRLRRISAPLDKLYAALDDYKGQPVLIAGAVVLAVLFQLGRVALFAVGGWALALDVSIIYYFVFVPVAIFVMLIPISFGGLGVREISLVSLMGLVGVEPEAAITLSLLAYILPTLAGALPGAWLYARSGLLPPKPE